MAKTALKGTPVTLKGTPINVGDGAPEVTLAAKDLSPLRVGGAKEKTQVLVVVPSLDTPVCAAEARKFNESTAKITNVEVTLISMDLPFAMGRFCTTEGIENLNVGSDFKSKEFANSYGVLIGDGPLEGLTGRAIFVINTKGEVTYKQIVPEITEEPDYEDVLKIL
ncbi:MAG: thiol peroxidase [Campylobacteraceae bacterium]|nr:thiol peroxidase [Campylobacteraceae bacterium]